MKLEEYFNAHETRL